MIKFFSLASKCLLTSDLGYFNLVAIDCIFSCFVSILVQVPKIEGELPIFVSSVVNHRVDCVREAGLQDSAFKLTNRHSFRVKQICSYGEENPRSRKMAFELNLQYVVPSSIDREPDGMEAKTFISQRARTD